MENNINNQELTRLAYETNQVQNACNFWAVVRTFCLEQDPVMPSRTSILRRLQDAGVNRLDVPTHPIVVCWIDKLSSLCDVQWETIEHDGAMPVETRLARFNKAVMELLEMMALENCPEKTDERVKSCVRELVGLSGGSGLSHAIKAFEWVDNQR